ncbi:phosphodiesterase [Symmachiella macrocystis]|uniref:Phosphodiesterase n=1 Tax=Symmachiella macrocystis TaxID=2527985 RepID=A0A5C6BQM1_9PLAN|nr:HDOD domain-containing protein [Symmachiella macrocystis]TWU12934.1 phosphodiesterase [Symmachiella macrocystis]
MVGSTMTLSEQMAALDRLVKRIDEISSLPDIAMRVIEVVSSPDSAVADLRLIVESDPALVARILRTANSSAYGLSTRVDSIHRAIALLGFNAVKDLAVTASIAQIFKDKTNIGTYSRAALWKHLVCVAVASRMIASRSGIQEFDEAYMCGLLHDIGIVLMDQHNHKGFLEVVEAISTEEPTLVTERRILGFDHTQLGSEVSQRWGFPTSVLQTIKYHHDTSRCDPEVRPIAQAVEVANFFCTKKNITAMGLMNIPAPAGETFAALSIGRNELKVLFQDLDIELEKSRDLYEL